MSSDETMPDSTSTDSVEDSANPRNFAMGTGVVFQSVGCILLFGGCCLWSISGHIVTPDVSPPDTWLGYFSSRTEAAAWTIGVLTSFVGGLALAAIGVGLQGERASSGKFSVIATPIFSGIYAVVAGLLGFGEGRWGAAIIPIVLAIVMFILFLMSLRSLHLLRRFPPPPHTEATEEVLDEIRKRREERRKYYDA